MLCLPIKVVREEGVALLYQTVPVQQLLIGLMLIPLPCSHPVTAVGPELSPVLEGRQLLVCAHLVDYWQYNIKLNAMNDISQVTLASYTFTTCSTGKLADKLTVLKMLFWIQRERQQFNSSQIKHTLCHTAAKQFRNLPSHHLLNEGNVSVNFSASNYISERQLVS